jgi:hypothetical protein
MRVRKVRGQNRVGKMTLDPTEVALARKLGIPLETYAKEALISIAKKRRWTWFFKEYK